MLRVSAPPPPAFGTVAVLLVNYNSGPLLKAALQSVAAQTRPPQEVIVVDNGSADGSADGLDMPDGIAFRVIRMARNLGFAEASNIAAAAATADWLAMLNCDAEADPDWIERLQDAAARHPGCALFASLQTSMDNTDLLDGAGDVMSATGLAWRGGVGRPAATARREGLCFGACAAGAFLSRDLYRRLGGFEASFFCYLEDLDFAYRARLAGETCMFIPGARIRHKGGAITGRHSAWTLRISARNRLLLLLRNAPLALLLLTAPLLVLGLLLGVLHGARHRRAHAVLMGYGDALAMLRTVLAQRRRLAPPLWPPRTVTESLNWNPLAVLTRPADIRPSPGKRLAAIPVPVQAPGPGKGIFPAE